jgi:aldehyde:ferredoxin oxidoreductase
MRGYGGKILEVDLATQSCRDTSFPDDVLRAYLGGRGLGAKILWDRLGSRWSSIDPIGSENLLLFLTGPLTGYFPGGRICITGKSPQSNGMVGSTVAGEFGIELKCGGYDGIIFSGVSEKPVYVLVFDGQVLFKDASHIWGMTGQESLKIITMESRRAVQDLKPGLGELIEPSTLYIGPAGERKVRIATVMAKWTHAAGYGGYGAVMGSKNLKAVVAKGTGPLPEAANMPSTFTLIERVCQACYTNDKFRRWGTGNLGYEVGAQTSSEPVRNWQEEWHDERSFGVDRFEQRVWIKRYWGDFGCPTTCLKLATPKTGPYKGAITDNPDYEIQAYQGTNLGVFTPEGNVYLSSLVDDLGVCGIQSGNVMGFAAELFQRGILTAEDIGFELNWGDVNAFAALSKKIAYRDGIGDILAEGTYRAARKISEMKGVDVLQYAVQSKGIAIGAHGIRSKLDYPVDISYACSTQGGDHTSVAMLPIDSGNSELTLALHDSGVYCWFNVFETPNPLIWEFLQSVTGWDITREEWYSTSSRKILAIQRAMLLLGGPDLTWSPDIHDDNPKRFYDPLPTGPKSGMKVEREAFALMKKEYYETLGWDDKGIPKPETLVKLGLEDIGKAFSGLQKL